MKIVIFTRCFYENLGRKERGCSCSNDLAPRGTTKARFQFASLTIAGASKLAPDSITCGPLLKNRAKRLA